MGNKVIAFDTETTGLIKNRLIPVDKQPKVIEFYGVLFDDETGVEYHELEFICDPKIQLEEIITRITGLTNADVDGKPTFTSMLDEVQSFFNQADTAIAHNISYDRDMINFEFKRGGRTINWPERMVCTVQETLGLKGHRLNLSALHEVLFGEQFEGAHRAREDVQALKRCYIELRKRELI